MVQPPHHLWTGMGVRHRVVSELHIRMTTTNSNKLVPNQGEQKLKSSISHYTHTRVIGVRCTTETDHNNMGGRVTVHRLTLVRHSLVPPTIGDRRECLATQLTGGPTGTCVVSSGTVGGARGDKKETHQTFIALKTSGLLRSARHVSHPSRGYFPSVGNGQKLQSAAQSV